MTLSPPPPEIIPKFINLLQRNKPLYIHGKGDNSRRYLHAGDAADAFDTILHKGSIGEIYNVDSKDEIENLHLAKKLCTAFGIGEEGFESRIQYTRDRPFNDCRYAVNGDKLAALGWKQRVAFEDGLAQCVDWYRKYSTWWGDIANILTPFPEISRGVDKAVGNGGGLEAEAGGRGGGFSGGPPAVQLQQQQQQHVVQAEVGAEPYNPACAGKKLVNGFVGKKRKADALDEVELLE